MTCIFKPNVKTDLIAITQHVFPTFGKADAIVFLSDSILANAIKCYKEKI